MTSHSGPAAASSAWYRRLLFSSLPASSPVPPILRTPGWEAVDHEIYAWLGVITRECVLPWYARITRDRELLSEVARITSHIVRNAEATLTQDAGERVQRLLLFELPTILRQHYVDFRAAQGKLHSAYIPPTSMLGEASAEERADELATIFHALQPHPALTPAGAVAGEVDALYLLTAIDEVLVALLPPQDTAAETERFIVRDVLGMVLRSVLSKCTRPWFIVQSLHKVLDGAAGQKDTRAEAEPVSPRVDPSPPLITRVLTGVFRACLLLHALVSMLLPPLLRGYLDLFAPAALARAAAKPRRRPWSVLHESSVDEGRLAPPGYGRAQGYMHGRDFSGASSATVASSRYDDAQMGAEHVDDIVAQSGAAAEQYPLALPAVSLLEEALSMRTRATSAQLASLTEFGIGLAGPALDRQLSTILRHAFFTNPARIAQSLRTARDGVFPNGRLPSPVPDPTPLEQQAAWERLVPRILGVLPAPARFLLLGSTASQQHHVLKSALTPLCSPSASGPNVHLLLLILERIFVLLVPGLEMGAGAGAGAGPGLEAEREEAEATEAAT